MKTRSANGGARRLPARKTATSRKRLTSSRVATPSKRTGRSGGTAGARRKSGSSRSAKSTVDHDEIQHWVEAHGGHPAIVKGTAKSDEGAGVLRIDFPGFSGEQTLKPVSWNRWFKVFDERRLAFLYRDSQSKGSSSRFNKLVIRKDSPRRKK